MPNEVFLRTEQELGTLVSPRVAHSLLQRVVLDGGEDPELVGRERMQELLLGPILRHLQAVLPPRGLKRNLERLARMLPAESPAEVAQEVVSTHVLVTTPVAPRVEVATLEASEFADAQQIDQAGSEELTAVSEEPAQSAPRLLDHDTWAQHASSLARIENIRLVAVVRGDRSLLQLGDDIDATELARLARTSYGLLHRSGPARALHLRHSTGEFLLYSVGSDLLVINGTTSLNIGAVGQAVAALVQEEKI